MIVNVKINEERKEKELWNILKTNGNEEGGYVVNYEI